jgi:Raf kinase inhibitor-like YbhB/YbcL family protein
VSYSWGSNFRTTKGHHVALAGRLLRGRRAGDTNLAWNLPNLAGPETLTLTSRAFTDGGSIPLENAGRRAGGQNISPELSWTQPPDGCAQLLLVIEDVDAPTPKPFVHCVALIDPARAVASQSTLDPGALSASEPGTGVQVLRSGMGRGYLGPEPIKGHGPHQYIFQLFALPTPMIGSSLEQTSPRTVLATVAGPVLARARLTGIYER